ncbi:MAG: hypothetical protein Q7U97_06730 [Rhodocyclaceae bacterium]|nr:hypothetical protein [Rhodocyclaceae bacterium]
MKRLEDWPERLMAFIEVRRGSAFLWGKNDCCTFTADAIVEMTGTDPMAELRGRYNSAKSAAVVMARVGGIEAWLDARLPTINPGLAQRGDVVMFAALDGPALGIVLGAQAAGVRPEGVTWVPATRWTKAWRV